MEQYCLSFWARIALWDPAPLAAWPRWGFGGAAVIAAQPKETSDDQGKVEAQARITRKRQQDQDP